MISGSTKKNNQSDTVKSVSEIDENIIDTNKTEEA